MRGSCERLLESATRLRVAFPKHFPVRKQRTGSPIHANSYFWFSVDFHRTRESNAGQRNERSQIGSGLQDDAMDGVKTDITGRRRLRIVRRFKIGEIHREKGRRIVEETVGA